MKLIIFGMAFLFLSSPLQALPKHYGPPYDTQPRNALDIYGEALAKQYQLKLLLSGTGSIVKSKGTWALHFTSSQKMTLEQGRPFAEEIAKRLIGFMSSNPLFTEFFKKAENYKRSTPSINDMGYKVAFWDEKINRPLPPYLAEIRLCDGKLYYYYANQKTQALEEPLIEQL